MVQVVTDRDSYVPKVWSRYSKPDIGLQYRVLNMLHERGLSGSKSIDRETNRVDDSVILNIIDDGPYEMRRSNNEGYCESIRL
ncbi:hypothetical protein ABN764_19805 [Paenibacillaceae sp. P-4]|uniref:hypothetical protein n=1 Tax=Paenibacillaceae bacterium P-4 TaxID=3160969 RepID=UPI0032E84924